MRRLNFKNVFFASVVVQIALVAIMLQTDYTPASEAWLIQDIFFLLYMVPGAILANTFYIEYFGLGLAIIVYALLMGWAVSLIKRANDHFSSDVS